jgi:hypothetical protein
MKLPMLKLLFVIFLILGISSFVVLQKNEDRKAKDEVGNVRYNSDMDNGFSEREARF